MTIEEMKERKRELGYTDPPHYDTLRALEQVLGETANQLIAGLIYTKLLNHALSRKDPCLPMISPVDVQLDCDQKTMVQPDVIIVCDRDKVINRCVYGAPDFVIEVLPKSTKKKDTVIKLNKYISAGVREYWMIDPYNQKVIVYDFDHDEYLI